RAIAVGIMVLIWPPSRQEGDVAFFICGVPRFSPSAPPLVADSSLTADSTVVSDSALAAHSSLVATPPSGSPPGTPPNRGQSGRRKRPLGDRQHLAQGGARVAAVPDETVLDE